MIEIILKKDTRRHDDKTSEGKPYIELFSEPRLMQCEIENGKICRMHLCSPENQRIPDGIQNILLESCKRNDIDAAKKAIEKGAYAADCRDDSRSCFGYAAESGSVELCRLLIEDDAGIKYGEDWQAVFYAVRNPDIEVLKYILIQDITLDLVTDFVSDDLPMTVLDYAKYVDNQEAVKILLELKVPTFQELKDWCFQSAKLKIRISEMGMSDWDMHIYGACEETDYLDGHISKSQLCFSMEMEDCVYFVVPFFLKYFKKSFDPYLGDNLVTFEYADNALEKIRNFCEMLKYDFNNPEVQKILDGAFSASCYIDWEGRCSVISWHFSDAEEKQLWKVKKQYLLDFYQEFCQKFEAVLTAARESGDCYIIFAGP